MLISSGTKWESEVGYSRAVRVDNLIFVSGTTAVDEQGNIIGKNLYEQTKFIIEKIDKALQQAGSSLKDTVQVTAFTTKMTEFDGFAKAFSEYFREIKPTSTLVEVQRLVNPELLIEIELTAFVLSEKS